MTEEVEQDTQETDGDAPKPDPAFTQADIDRIVKERLDRVKARYADYDDLKSKGAKLDELERAKMDEYERLAADLKALEDRAAAATNDAALIGVALEAGNNTAARSRSRPSCTQTRSTPLTTPTCAWPARERREPPRGRAGPLGTVQRPMDRRRGGGLAVTSCMQSHR